MSNIKIFFLIISISLIVCQKENQTKKAPEAKKIKEGKEQPKIEKNDQSAKK